MLAPYEIPDGGEIEEVAILLGNLPKIGLGLREFLVLHFQFNLVDLQFVDQAANVSVGHGFRGLAVLRAKSLLGVLPKIGNVHFRRFLDEFSLVLVHDASPRTFVVQSPQRQSQHGHYSSSCCVFGGVAMIQADMPAPHATFLPTIEICVLSSTNPRSNFEPGCWSMASDRIGLRRSVSGSLKKGPIPGRR